MIVELPDDVIYKIADNSTYTPLYAHVAQAVSMHFRSMHYLSSKLICSCVILNLLLNDKITPNSADKIITCLRRRTKSLYTTIDNAFVVVEDDFDEYAKTILGDGYESIIALDMRNTNFIVYVISLDLYNNYKFDKSSVFYAALDYNELFKYNLQ